MRRLALAALIAATLAGSAPAQDASGPAPIDVSAVQIDRFGAATPVGARYGSLTFLGGIKLVSSDPDFGGLSGLRLEADGEGLTAISDRGNWFRGKLTYADGRLAGVADMRRMATPGRDGRPLPGRRGFDTEGLEIEGRTAWVTAERVNWLTRYALDADGFPSGAGQAMALPKAPPGVARNGGYESLARSRDGGLILIAQTSRSDDAFPAFVVGGKKPFAFSLARSDDFRPTDLTRLPNGGFVLLERRYQPPFSLSVRMKRIAEKDVAPGAVVDGPVLMEASLAQGIDNFEGISAHRGADGRTVLTVVSDDNFHPLQRTLLMQFALDE